MSQTKSKNVMRAEGKLRRAIDRSDQAYAQLASARKAHHKVSPGEIREYHDPEALAEEDSLDLPPTTRLRIPISRGSCPECGARTCRCKTKSSQSGSLVRKNDMK